jgi:L-aminopeptidase/D-esterase-like protein
VSHMLELAVIKVGHETRPEFHTGCTVCLCPAGGVGGVDLGGQSPGSRETVLLAPD